MTTVSPTHTPTGATQRSLQPPREGRVAINPLRYVAGLAGPLPLINVALLKK